MGFSCSARDMRRLGNPCVYRHSNFSQRLVAGRRIHVALDPWGTREAPSSGRSSVFMFYLTPRRIFTTTIVLFVNDAGVFGKRSFEKMTL